MGILKTTKKSIAVILAFLMIVSVVAMMPPSASALEPYSGTINVMPIPDSITDPVFEPISFAPQEPVERHPDLTSREALRVDYEAGDLQFLTIGECGRVHYDEKPIVFPPTSYYAELMKPEYKAVLDKGFNGMYDPMTGMIATSAFMPASGLVHDMWLGGLRANRIARCRLGIEVSTIFNVYIGGLGLWTQGLCANINLAPAINTATDIVESSDSLVRNVTYNALVKYASNPLAAYAGMMVIYGIPPNTAPHTAARRDMDLEHRIATEPAPAGWRAFISAYVLGHQAVIFGFMDDGTEGIEEPPQMGRIMVEKRDVQTGTAQQGGATLGGGTFQIMQSGTVIETIVMERGSRFGMSGLLPLGHYEVREITAPRGYQLNSTPENVEIVYTPGAVEADTVFAVISNQVMRGNMLLTKTYEHILNHAQQITLGGSKWTIQEVNTGAFARVTGPVLTGGRNVYTAVPSGGFLANATTPIETPGGAHTTGQLSVNGLPFGIYRVTEIDSGRTPNDLALEYFIITIDRHEANTNIFANAANSVVQNYIIRNQIEIVKIDEETGRTIGAANTGFRIRAVCSDVCADINCTAVVIRHDKGEIRCGVFMPNTANICDPAGSSLFNMFYTDAFGRISLLYEIPFGNYYLEEIQAPEGYFIGLWDEHGTGGRWDATANPDWDPNNRNSVIEFGLEAQLFDPNGDPVDFDSDINVTFNRYPFSVLYQTGGGQVHVVEIRIPNRAVQGRVEIVKVAEQLAGFKLNEDAGIWEPVYEMLPLEGAEFEIIAAQDIERNDGFASPTVHDWETDEELTVKLTGSEHAKNRTGTTETSELVLPDGTVIRYASDIGIGGNNTRRAELITAERTGTDTWKLVYENTVGIFTETIIVDLAFEFTPGGIAVTHIEMSITITADSFLPPSEFDGLMSSRPVIQDGATVLDWDDTNMAEGSTWLRPSHNTIMMLERTEEFLTIEDVLIIAPLLEPAKSPSLGDLLPGTDPLPVLPAGFVMAELSSDYHIITDGTQFLIAGLEEPEVDVLKVIMFGENVRPLFDSEELSYLMDEAIADMGLAEVSTALGVHIYYDADTDTYYSIERHPNLSQTLKSVEGNMIMVANALDDRTAYLSSDIVSEYIFTPDGPASFVYYGILGLEAHIETIRAEAAKPDHDAVRDQITTMLDGLVLWDISSNAVAAEMMEGALEYMYELLDIDETDYSIVFGELIPEYEAWLSGEGYTKVEVANGNVRVYTKDSVYYAVTHIPGIGQFGLTELLVHDIRGSFAHLNIAPLPAGDWTLSFVGDEIHITDGTIVYVNVIGADGPKWVDLDTRGYGGEFNNEPALDTGDTMVKSDTMYIKRDADGLYYTWVSVSGDSGEWVRSTYDGLFEKAVSQTYRFVLQQAGNSSTSWNVAFEGVDVHVSNIKMLKAKITNTLDAVPVISTGNTTRVNIDGNVTELQVGNSDPVAYFKLTGDTKVKVQQSGSNAVKTVLIPLTNPADMDLVNRLPTINAGDGTPIPLSVFILASAEEVELYNVRGQTVIGRMVSVGSTAYVELTVTENATNRANAVNVHYPDGNVSYAFLHTSGSGFPQAALRIIGYARTTEMLRGTVIDELTTGTDGIARSKAIPLGNYIVREKQSGHMAVANNYSHIVTLDWENQFVPIVWRGVDARNNAVLVQLDILKGFQQYIGSDEFVPRAGAVFGIFAHERIAGRGSDIDGVVTSIPAGALVATVETDANGRTLTAVKLPMGRYYVREISTLDGYILSTQRFPFEVNEHTRSGAFTFEDDVFGISGTVRSTGINTAELELRTLARLPMPDITVSGMKINTGLEFGEDNEVLRNRVSADVSITTVTASVGRRAVVELENGLILTLYATANGYVIRLDGDTDNLEYSDSLVNTNIKELETRVYEYTPMVSIVATSSLLASVYNPITTALTADDGTKVEFINSSGVEGIRITLPDGQSIPICDMPDECDDCADCVDCDGCIDCDDCVMCEAIESYVCDCDALPSFIHKSGNVYLIGDLYDWDDAIRGSLFSKTLMLGKDMSITLENGNIVIGEGLTPTGEPGLQADGTYVTGNSIRIQNTIYEVDGVIVEILPFRDRGSSILLERPVALWHNSETVDPSTLMAYGSGVIIPIYTGDTYSIVLSNGRTVGISLDYDRELDIEVISFNEASTADLPLLLLNEDENNFKCDEGEVIEQKFPLDAITFCEITMQLVKSLTMARNDTFVNQIVVRINANSNLNPELIRNYSDGSVLPEVMETRLRKVDAVTNEPLAGARLEVRNSNNDIVAIETTGANGYTPRFEVEPGRHFVRELDAPEGYIQSEEVFVFNVQANGAVTGTVIIPNERENPLRSYIWKFNAQFTNEPVAGALIHIFNEDGSLLFETESDEFGRAWFNVPRPGNYSFREISAPEGYHLNTRTYSFRVNNNGTISTDDPHLTNGILELGNIPEMIELIKIDGYFVDELRGLKGAELEIMNERNERVDILVSDENGRMRVRLTDLGIYKFRETRSPDGFVIDETVYIFELRDDGRIDGKLTLINHREDDSSRFVPQTGVDSNRTLLITLMILSGAGLTVIAVVVFGKPIMRKIRRTFM